jgi:hypothetical protein
MAWPAKTKRPPAAANLGFESNLSLATTLFKK